MIIDVDKVVGDNTALVILHPTGIKYTAQCGGMACTHPEAEGICISLGSLGQNFDDCKYGCWHIGTEQNKTQNRQLATDLDYFLLKETVGWKNQIRFDFMRIDELQEGWWPVTISGELFDGLYKVEKHEMQLIDKNEFKGFIHTGNCD